LWYTGLFRIVEDVRLNDVVPDHIVFTQVLPVPRAFDPFPGLVGKRGVGAYRKFWNVVPGSRTLLEFESVSRACRIFVNKWMQAIIVMPFESDFAGRGKIRSNYYG
jgi:hypothetical protein